MKIVLNIGSGPHNPARMHPFFRDGTAWRQLRVDIDPYVEPDIVASAVDLSAFASGSVDAVWSSHHLEHLYEHEAAQALSEFRRVLRPNGFALLTMPDLTAVAELVAQGRADEIAYRSPAGPVTAMDMLYGFRPALRAGRVYMAHRTGYTADRLYCALEEAGFPRAQVRSGDRYDLWAAAFMEDTTIEVRL
ncbi:methyltransferase domain-containing protein [Methylobacterium sp. WL103]|uniref:class I SAM-dependent methyltransferase n=1 Tax=Methylobacterium sp. WL103 TaxID=2603891 RepID=UPI0011C7AD31|nr:methyltransferase domain-containing protein [Methylobacterium sp. WL103]TXN07166.1 methyltransferase domain-containing protein [Methylobacterium sp. WL103]